MTKTNTYTTFHIYKKTGDNEPIMYNKVNRNLQNNFSSDEYISIGDKAKRINIENGTKKISYEQTNKNEFKQLMKEQNISKLRKKIKCLEKTRLPTDSKQQKITDMFPKKSKKSKKQKKSKKKKTQKYKWNRMIEEYSSDTEEGEIKEETLEDYYNNNPPLSIHLEEINEDLRFDEGFPYSKDDFPRIL